MHLLVPKADTWACLQLHDVMLLVGLQEDEDMNFHCSCFVYSLSHHTGYGPINSRHGP